MLIYQKALSALALAVAMAATQQAFATDATQAAGMAAEQSSAAEGSSQAQSKGFVDDSSLRLEHRTFAYYVNNKNNNNAAANFVEFGVAENTSQNYINEWAQAALLSFSSGYTQGRSALAWMPSLMVPHA